MTRGLPPVGRWASWTPDKVERWRAIADRDPATWTNLERKVMHWIATVGLARIKEGHADYVWVQRSAAALGELQSLEDRT